MNTASESYFFIGVAGTGMSALAQYLANRGHRIEGSDRQFGPFPPRVQEQLQAQGVLCHPQDGSGVQLGFQWVVVSTAIEKGNPDLDKALELGIPVLHRSELLERITRERRTIAISGTSGKSSVTGMTWHILNYAGLSPSLISGAGLSQLEAQGLIGNAVAGSGEWLVIEADESDGTLVRYKPEIGTILNLDKDHKEIGELEELFKTFSANTSKTLIVNGDHPRTKQFSRDKAWEFGHEGWQGFQGIDFSPKGTGIEFRIRHFGQLVRFYLPVPGRHNMENAQAAVACAVAAGVSLRTCADALESWGGIHRRHQIMGKVQGITLVDDFAHNPAKIAASIKACQSFTTGRIIAWYQPHGFAPTRFMRSDLVQELSQTLRSQGSMNERDLMFFSKIYYAGGTAQQDISSQDLVSDLQALGVDAVCIDNRHDAAQALVKAAYSGDTILLMGARDPSLADFAKEVLAILERNNRCV